MKQRRNDFLERLRRSQEAKREPSGAKLDVRTPEQMSGSCCASW